MNDTVFDVVQVGYGPVSKVMALMLARNGWSVGIFERFPQPYVLPRAVCIDHEINRALRAIGLDAELDAVVQPPPIYKWYNAAWQELLSLDWGQESVSGGPGTWFLHQPSFESALDVAVRACPNIHISMGQEVVAARQDASFCTIDLRDAAGNTRQARGRYLVGVDGANSIIRRGLGIAQDDLGFEADWLVVDMLLHPGVSAEQLGIPLCGQYCNPVRPTTIVPGGRQGGRECRRWEFMRLPGESRESLESVETLWELLGPWVPRDKADLVRHTIYTFRSLIAQQWRVGRMLLAGDAAHVMPPFMGQGMCAGLRDAANLAWKLDLVLRGTAEDTLLDSYGTERRPHVRDIIEISVYLGKVICTPDADIAAERDRSFLAGEAPPPPPFPHMVDGLLARRPDGTPQAPAGELSPHGIIISGADTEGWDRLVGLGFTLITTGFDAQAALSPGQRAGLAAIGVRLVRLEPAGQEGTDFLRDRDGNILNFLRQHQVSALLVRPDFTVFGGATNAADLPELVTQLIDQLGCHFIGLPKVMADRQMAE